MVPDLFTHAAAARTAFAAKYLPPSPLPSSRDQERERRVELRYASGPARAVRPDSRVMVAAVLPAIGQLLGDLGVEPDALAVRQLEVNFRKLTAVLLLPPTGVAHEAGRVVAVVVEGLTAAELMLGLAWWAAYGEAVRVPAPRPAQ